MTTIISAHFDGQVIVPEESLLLTPGEKVRVTIEREEVAQAPQSRRQAGSARGQVWLSPDFDALLPEFENLA
jgi:predicted DNA-binding antitoxin AbrB/MazE fold protein